MTRFVALLRGVNVGKAKRVPMAEFRSLLEGLGCTGVKTLLNSGNAVFDAAGRATAATQAQRIRQALADELGVDVPVIVKSARDWDAIVAGNPLLDGAPAPIDPARLLVVFTADAAALAALSAVEPLVSAPERFAIGRHAAYLHCANGILDSPAGAALLGRAGRAATTRNWATVLKLQALTSTPADPPPPAPRPPRTPRPAS